MIKTSYNSQYFNNILYKAEPFSSRDIERFKTIYSYKKSGNVLEIGCGEGYLLAMLAKKFSITGVEISPYAAKIAKSLTDSEHIIIGNVENFDADGSSYDIIVAYNILEHVKNPKKLIKKLSSTLKKGGLLIGSVPNNQKYFGKMVTRMFNIIDKTHLSTLPVPKWRKLFIKNGLEMVDEFGENPISRNYSKYVKSSNWQELSANYIFVYKKT